LAAAAVLALPVAIQLLHLALRQYLPLQVAVVIVAPLVQEELQVVEH
jgi:hypothetical protein